jgi:hypothetical protein
LLRIKENTHKGLESIIGRTMNEFFTDIWCIHVRTIGSKSEEITEKIFQLLRFPITTAINKDCKGHAIISDTEMDAVDLVCNMNPSSENRLVILVLNAISQILEHSNDFGQADVILVNVDKMYRLVISRNFRHFEEVPGGSDLWPGKTNPLPNFMGRTLQVGTFRCPPFSFGAAGNMSSAKAGDIADGEFLTDLTFDYL